MPASPTSRLSAVLTALLLSVGAVRAGGQFALPAELRVGSEGVWLNELCPGDPLVPTVRVADAPAPGRVLLLTRSQVAAALRDSVPGISLTNFTGSAQVRVARRMRRLEEAELVSALTAAMQADVVRDGGQLELQVSRPWAGMSIPDEPFTVKVGDLPANGLQSRSLIRCELRGNRESFGVVTLAVEAKVWAEIWVARSAIPRQTSFREADLVRERRDVLVLHQPLAPVSPGDDRFELGEGVAAGSPIYARMVRLRPVIRRGKLVDAVFADGALSITLRVEALEDGVPGQVVRARNLNSKRELRGKVQDEQTILVSL